MKSTLLILIAATLAIGCNNTTTTTTTTTVTDSATVITTTDPKHDLYILDSVLKQYETPTQHLKASANTPMKVAGAKGTIIAVNPQDLATVSGKPMGNHIDIDLKELTTTEELARERAATVSDGKLLVSGGAYYINMTSGGEQLKLKEGKTLSVRFPKITKEEMSLFYGQRDGLGQMNWKGNGTIIGGTYALPNTKAENVSVNTVVEAKLHDHNPTDTVKMTEGEKKDYTAQNTVKAKIYEETRLQSFGWINCDHFVNDGNLTTCVVSVDQADTINYASAYLIFKDINSVMQGYFQTSKEQCTFPNIPVGSKVALIMVGYKNGKMFTAASKILVAADKKVSIKLKETAEAEVGNLFKLQ